MFSNDQVLIMSEAVARDAFVVMDEVMTFMSPAMMPLSTMLKLQPLVLRNMWPLLMASFSVPKWRTLSTLVSNGLIMFPLVMLKEAKVTPTDLFFLIKQQVKATFATIIHPPPTTLQDKMPWFQRCSCAVDAAQLMLLEGCSLWRPSDIDIEKTTGNVFKLSAVLTNEEGMIMGFL